MTMSRQLTVNEHIKEVETSENTSCCGANNAVKEKNDQKDTERWPVSQIYRAVGPDC